MISNRKSLRLLGAAPLTVLLVAGAQTAADPYAVSAPWLLPSQVVGFDNQPRQDHPWPSPDEREYECRRRC
jgi:hypothetical protein